MLPREESSMAITLRNKGVEADIREIGAQTGEGPSAVIARLVASERARLAAERERTVAEKLARLRVLRDTYPKFTEEERKAAWEDADRIFDYLYEDETRE